MKVLCLKTYRAYYLKMQPNIILAHHNRPTPTSLPLRAHAHTHTHIYSAVPSRPPHPHPHTPPLPGRHRKPASTNTHSNPPTPQTPSQTHFPSTPSQTLKKKKCIPSFLTLWLSCTQYMYLGEGGGEYLLEKETATSKFQIKSHQNCLRLGRCRNDRNLRPYFQARYNFTLFFRGT